jgi:hypothetical protein
MPLRLEFPVGTGANVQDEVFLMYLRLSCLGEYKTKYAQVAFVHQCLMNVYLSSGECMLSCLPISIEGRRGAKHDI